MEQLDPLNVTFNTNDSTRVTVNLGTAAANILSQASERSVVKNVRLAGDTSLNLLRDLVKNVDNPVLKTVSTDMINFLSECYNEEVICCLLKNLMTSLLCAVDLKNLSGYLNGTINADNELKMLGLLGVINELIMIIDVIISLIQMDIRDITIPIIDFSAIIMDSVLSSILLCIKEIVETLGDSAINYVVDAVDKIGNQDALKCLPFMDLVDLIKRYLGTFGSLFDWFNKMEEGYIAKLRSKWKIPIDVNYVKNIKFLEFLKNLRDILIQLKSATIDWELCLDLNLSTSILDNPIKNPLTTGGDYLDNILGKTSTAPNLSKLNTTIADDGTILQNSANDNKLGRFRPLTDDEVNSFLTSKLGFPKDIADQLTGMTNSTTNIQGTLSDNPHLAGRDCAYTLNPKELLNTIIQAAQQVR